MSHDRYGRDVLSGTGPRSDSSISAVDGDVGLVLEHATSGWCGAVVGWQKGADGWAVLLEDRHGTVRPFAAGPSFLVDGRLINLTRPASTPPEQAPTRTASGSIAVADHRARVALPSRIWVEGKHDAELVERVWGADLRIEGVVVEELGGIDDLADRIATFDPGEGRRIGVLVDHLVSGSKESRIADAVLKRWSDDVLVVGHPFVDVWQAVSPQSAGIAAWPEVPRHLPWKEGVCQALGWSEDTGRAWRELLARVGDYTDLEPALLGRVEELIDFVTRD